MPRPHIAHDIRFAARKAEHNPFIEDGLAVHRIHATGAALYQINSLIEFHICSFPRAKQFSSQPTRPKQEFCRTGTKRKLRQGTLAGVSKLGF
jgi:hypothetical protein